MKNLLTAIMLMGSIAVAIPAVSAMSLQTGTRKTDTLKKTQAHTMRHTPSQRARRARMQQRQAQKHLKENQKVQQAQQELKKDTTQHH